LSGGPTLLIVDVTVAIVRQEPKFAAATMNGRFGVVKRPAAFG